MVRPKKNLGQHFLTDPSIARRITDALVLPSPSTVMEIGPGTGILTTELLSRPEIDLIPVEIDKEAAGYLLEKWPQLRDRLWQEDVLRADIGARITGPFHVIGNFPYNISSQIFFKLLDYRDQVEQIVCMLQKEVAQRLVAPPGNKEYGILSVFLQAYYETEFLFSVKPGSFFPPPRVTSAVIRLTRNQVKNLDCDERLFRTIVKTTFNQRRKTIRNSIRPVITVFSDELDLLSLRPEQLDVNEFVRLTRWVAERQAK